MRRKKLIVLVFIIFILSLTVIFSNAEQDKRIRRITNRPPKNIYSIKNNFRKRRVRYNQQRYSFPSRNNQPQYVPGEIIVRFKMPLSDFEVAYLFGEFQPKIIGASRMLNGSYVIRFPENCSVEHMVQVFERNPYVKFAEPNGIGHLLKRPDDFGNYSRERPQRERDTKRFPKALNKEDMLHKDTHGRTNPVLTASNSGLKAVNKDNGIPPYPETNDNMRVTQSSDNNRILRSKAKIYTYRDSESRLVITNYYCYKSKTNKK